jgi:phenylpropionate dioxygenase-like ring-hydroxylating dioxygenase large terminal subunit
MAGMTASIAASTVRADFVPTEHYTSREFLQREKERLWPKVWQVACREEEVPAAGSFVTYDIGDESITVVRGSDSRIRAFFNVCQHRGRRLTKGCGKMNRFHCGFHGWQYRLDGSIERVLDRDDWTGCGNFGDADLSLKEVRADVWGGFVFVNPDRDAEPLAAYLDPVPHYLDPFELERMRYRWYVSVKVPCNWKVAVEAFNEAYHVSATHPQLLPTYGNDVSRTRTFGRHGNFFYPIDPSRPLGAPSPRTNLPVPEDLRPSIIEYYDTYHQTLRAIFSERDVEAARRLMTEVPAATPGPMLLMKLLEFQREAAIAAGAGWPDISLEQLGAAGIDWHIFPNLVMLPYPDGVLAYRALPDADNPNICLFDVYALQRYAPGAEPELTRQYFYGDDDWRTFEKVSPILQQDFNNMGEVQRGMKSQGFGGARTNPLQESTVSNFHRVLCDYLDAAP